MAAFVLTVAPLALHFGGGAFAWGSPGTVE